MLSSQVLSLWLQWRALETPAVVMATPHYRPVPETAQNLRSREIGPDFALVVRLL